MERPCICPANINRVSPIGAQSGIGGFEKIWAKILAVLLSSDIVNWRMQLI
jgi:hypothetical protein